MRLQLLILIAILAQVSLAENIIRHNGLILKLNNVEGGNTCEIVGNVFTEDTKFVLPYTIQYNDDVYKVIGIGDSSFKNCDHLLSIEIPTASCSPIYIGNEAFASCDKLECVVLPSNVTSLGWRAFENCANLRYVSFEENMPFTTIARYAFARCWNLENVKFPLNLLTIEDYAFDRCKLQDLTLPNSLVSIGKYAFIECQFESLVIPNSVRYINSHAFDNCYRMTSVTLPPEITYLSSESFFWSNKIKDIFYNTLTPIEVSKDLFVPRTYTDATLHVAKGGLQAAYSTSPWMYFINIIEEDLNSVNELNRLYDMPTEIYDLNGVKTNFQETELPPGQYIMRKGKSMKKVLIK